MTIEDAEAIYGKRWNYWSQDEIKQFMSQMEPKDMNTPLLLRWAFEYEEWLNPACKKHFDELIELARK